MAYRRRLTVDAGVLLDATAHLAMARQRGTGPLIAYLRQFAHTEADAQALLNAIEAEREINAAQELIVQQLPERRR